MTKKTNKEIMEMLMNISKGMEKMNNEISSLRADVDSLKGIEKTSKKSSKGSKKTASSQKKTSEKKTREEALTEKYGTKEDRSSFVALRNQVAEEFSNLAKEHEVYIPRKKYQAVLRDTTVSLNGRMNKKAVAKAFLAAAK